MGAARRSNWVRSCMDLGARSPGRQRAPCVQANSCCHDRPRASSRRDASDATKLHSLPLKAFTFAVTASVEQFGQASRVKMTTALSALRSSVRSGG